MRLSTRVRYAARALLDIALHPEESPVSLSRIGERQEVSPKYLEQLLGALQAAGLVRSVRGRRGGYALARAPEEITVRDVYHAVEGTTPPTPCDEDPPCQRVDQCVLADVWQDMYDAMMARLAAYTFADLAAQARQRRSDCGPPMFHI